MVEPMYTCSGLGDWPLSKCRQHMAAVEESKLLRAQCRANQSFKVYVSESSKVNSEAADVYRLVGKRLAETCPSKVPLKLTSVKQNFLDGEMRSVHEQEESFDVDPIRGT